MVREKGRPTSDPIHRWKTSSLFLLVTVLSVFVIVATAFYLFSLHPKFPVMINIGDHVGLDNIERNSTLGDNKNGGNIDGDYIEFQKQWFRMQRARIDWEAMLNNSCGYVNSVKSKTLIGWGKINETSKEMSFVEYMDIRPAGQFSRIFIRTRTKDGRKKQIGGDFWMVSS